MKFILAKYFSDHTTFVRPVAIQNKLGVHTGIHIIYVFMYGIIAPSLLPCAAHAALTLNFGVFRLYVNSSSMILRKSLLIT